MVSNFKDKAEAGVSFFSSLFKEKEGCYIQEILQVLRLFPRYVCEDMNDSLANEVSEEEISNIVHSFQRGKSPGPDGFTIEFLQGFYYSF